MTDRQGLRNELPVRAFDEHCDLHQYDVLSRRERRLTRPSRRATSEYLPAIDAGRLVFARQQALKRGRQPRIPRIVAARLSPYREAALPRPPGRSRDVADGENQGPRTIDAAGGLAVVGWTHVPRVGACDVDPISPPSTDYQILLYDLRTRTRRTLDDDCTVARGQWFGSPSLSSGAVFYTFTPAGPDVTFGLRRFEIATGVRSDGPVARQRILSSQTADGWTWTATDVVTDGRHATEIARVPTG